MAKESGIGMTLQVDDSGGTLRALTTDATAVNFATPRTMQDITGLNSSAVERLLLLADFSITMTAVFNDAVNTMHDVFKTIPSTSVTRTVTIAISGQTLTNEAILTDYPLTRAASGELTTSVPGTLNSTVVPTWA